MKKLKITKYEIVPSEAQMQMALVEYCDAKKYPVFHIPNEGKRSEAAGRKLKKMGMRKGIPDLFFPVPNQKHHGLFIELKRNEKALLGKEQAEWIVYLNELGYRALRCSSLDDAILNIEDYMNGIKKNYLFY